MDNPVVAGSDPPNGRKLEIALLVIVVVVATLLIVGTIRLRRAGQERAAIHRAWKLGTVVLFDGDKEYTNPPLTPAEWDAELRRSWVEDLFAASPTAIVFVRFSRHVNWPEPIVDDGDIPELIEILRLLPTVRSVQLDKNITSAGKSRLESTLPTILFFMPANVP